MTYRIADEFAMQGFGGKIAKYLRIGDIIGLRGALGAGKSTLTRGLLSALGYAEEAPSPSFAIVQPYAPPEVTLPLAHVDLYRIDDPSDVTELALDEYLADGALVIEWPDRLGALFANEILLLDLTVRDDGSRRLTATVPTAWKERWPLI
jgi:tRNA threonylcarbamoyladenosine biosynthesis protein TsaE